MITMNEMANSYANNLQEEIKRAENNLEEQQRYVAQLRSHFNECVNALQNNTSNQNTALNSPPASVPLSAINPQLESRIENADGSVSETISVNPFIQSK
jgi:chromosome segregation ATPase